MSDPKPREPIWPIRLVHIAKERDRARDVAVALEQENARLRDALHIKADAVPDTSGLLAYAEEDFDGWVGWPGEYIHQPYTWEE